MAEDPAPSKASEHFRDLLVAKYHSSTARLSHLPFPLNSINHNEISRQDFVPKSSSDSALTAFAQLGTLRLNVSRVLISLLDSQYQYILAEATRTLSTQLDSRHDPTDSLWTGSVIIPRKEGVCKTVVEAFPDHKVREGQDKVDCVIVQDLRTDERFRDHSYVVQPPFHRFYAGLPLRTADGTTIGVYCVFDDQPRDGLSDVEIQFLHDMTTTVVDHLEAVNVRAEHERGQRLVRGLESFVQANTKLNKYADDQHQHLKSEQTVLGLTDETSPFPVKVDQTPSTKMDLWESSLPKGSRNMFSRAASIIMQSTAFDGVAFFYVASPSSQTRSKLSGTAVTSSIPSQDNDGQHVHSSSTTHAPIFIDSTTEDSDASMRPPSSSACSVLGFSVKHMSKELIESPDRPFPHFTHGDTERVMGHRPRGRIYALNDHGQVLSNVQSSSNSSTDQTTVANDQTRIKRKQAHRITSLLKLDPEARGFLSLPLWDYERQKWFALCVCWRRGSARIAEFESHLPFLRVFGNSIMNALAHLDAVESNRAKTTFISSISHELRSPLHGILGGTTMLNDSPLNRFQQEMVDSINNCGNTLLDTVEHVMDFARINYFSQNDSHRLARRKYDQAPFIDPLNIDDASTKPASVFAFETDLNIVLEEVVEAVMMGFVTPYDDSELRRLEGGLPSISPPTKVGYHSPTSTAGILQRGAVRVILDIHPSNYCRFDTPPGAWRRIFMNLFSNSIKYTTKGLITVTLRITAHKEDDSHARVTFTVTDTGKGMSDNYLQHHLFRPFSQEDSFAAGTGLGLSIVQQIVQSVNGTIDVTSTQDVGTVIKVISNLTMVKSNSNSIINVDVVPLARQRLRKRRICLLLNASLSLANDVRVENMAKYANAISTILRDWLAVDAFVRSTWLPGCADIVICPEPSFKDLDLIRSESNGKNIPPVLFIASDNLEMFALRADARIRARSSIVEITAQPCGPRKLSKVLLQCLDTLEQEIDHESPAVTSPDLATNNADEPLASSLSTMHLHEPKWIRSESVNQPLTQDSQEDDKMPILIVDDNTLNRRLLTTFLERKTVQFQEAENGKVALDLYRALVGRFRCILMDISMPVMDGVTATREIRAYEQATSLKRTTIIALTGLASASARMEAIEAGMDEYLTKPISFSRLDKLLQ